MQAFVAVRGNFLYHVLLVLQNLQAADSANFSEDAQGRGVRSGSTSAPHAHSPRLDSLQHTPRHHIKSREPASVPKANPFSLLKILTGSLLISGLTLHPLESLLEPLAALYSQPSSFSASKHIPTH